MERYKYTSNHDRSVVIDTKTTRVFIIENIPSGESWVVRDFAAYLNKQENKPKELRFAKLRRFICRMVGHKPDNIPHNSRCLICKLRIFRWEDWKSVEKLTDDFREKE